MDAVLHGAQYRKDHEFCDGIELGQACGGPNESKPCSWHKSIDNRSSIMQYWKSVAFGAIDWYLKTTFPTVSLYIWIWGNLWYFRISQIFKGAVYYRLSQYITSFRPHLYYWLNLLYLGINPSKRFLILLFQLTWSGPPTMEWSPALIWFLCSSQ